MALQQSDSANRSEPEHPAASIATRLAIASVRSQSDESWVEIASQPSSSSLSSAADEDSTTSFRFQDDQRPPPKRVPSRSRNVSPAPKGVRSSSVHGASSQEEYDESESESDRIMTSSGEAPHLLLHDTQRSTRSSTLESDDDDENRTAVNHPISSGNVFTPQPNAFSHPPATQLRSASQPMPGSYFPTVHRASTSGQPDIARQRSSTQQHLPRNVLSPSLNVAAHHDEALRNSLSTLLSCAAAARGLKNDSKTRPSTSLPQRSRIEPMALRILPESALPAASPAFDLQAPVFKPTLRRHSTTTTSTSPDRAGERTKRSVPASGKERRVAKKVRRSSSAEELFVSPTLLTWVVSAGVVVVLSALSFSAGYSLGKEAGRAEAGTVADLAVGDRGIVRDCAREASRSGLGLKRSLARSAVQV